jgi:hypothetical protein
MVDSDLSLFLFFPGCLLKGIPILEGLERGRQSSGSEPDKGIIGVWAKTSGNGSM